MLGYFILYEVLTVAFIIGMSWYTNAPLGPQTAPSDALGHLVFYILAGLVGLIVSFAAVLIQGHHAEQRRWDAAVFQTYSSIRNEARTWNWRLLGIQEMNGSYTIDCVNGCYLLRFQAQAKFVDMRPGEADQVSFSKIGFVTPGPIDDIREPGVLEFGGNVTVTYTLLSGPPQLQDSYGVNIPPRPVR